MTGIDYNVLVDTLVSHMMTTGRFDRVNAHDIINGPGKGVTGTVVWASTGPAPRGSGLAATSALVAFGLQILVPGTMLPRDAIDPTLHDAVNDTFANISADFTLNNVARMVDLLGAYGPGLSARGGWLTVDNTLYRAADLSVMAVIDDVYPQAP